MAFKLLSDLPAELLIRVSEFLDAKDCASLSAANSSFRRFLASTVYRGLRATSLPEHAEILEQIVTKHARHIHTLHFELYLNESEESGDNTYTVSSTAPIVWDLLSRRALPNVSTLTITFFPQPDNYDGGGWCDEGLGGGIYINDSEESIDEVPEAEANFPWRALYSKALESIANGPKTLHRLEVLNLPPKTTSAQQTPEWQAMLGGLEEFELSLWGGDNGVGWHSNTLPGYLDSIENLRDSFFRHLMKATTVKLVAHPDNPIGCEGMRQVFIPIQPKDLPNVQHLTLHDCFVDHALTANLAKKPGQLKSFHLNNCYSAGNDENFGTAHTVLTWSEFFSTLRQTQPNLSDFILKDKRTPPLTHDEQFYRAGEEGPVVPYEPPDQEPENVKAVRKGLQEHPSRRLFTYTTLDDKYGMVFAYEEVNIEAFMLGEDQKEFDLLVEMVEGNRREGRDA
ncbi:hypothetical protein M409DRAFT_18495 [Zasmidium cellare ATCC 36951]|uniref:F-box domain-containing protein n=1 Tax=Zasmidium cellare ATCC 36951 TaxID=1080233 RepID=A0A6A6CZX4_ZASCE|nr:uncharacterized protein M409DRAFT_18495 [Zasmidium cellare ATCC 36951]KAF2171379.1 hypothetical protein M409DRAFT_18495 [Zasmidium cellare ATCC 36951]